MKRETILKHEFVEYIPAELDDGTIYVSIPYETVVHRCCCGCGNKVVTPLSPRDWKLIFDGQSISLDPSIGNWSFSCQSHYWITRNKVKWAWKWSPEEIDAARVENQLDKEDYYQRDGKPVVAHARNTVETDARKSVWQKLKTWWLSGWG